MFPPALVSEDVAQPSGDEPTATVPTNVAQYADGSRLAARWSLHERFSTNPTPWPVWVFDHLLTFGSELRVLEIGCGLGQLWAQNIDRVPSAWSLTLTDASAGMVEATTEAVAGLASPVEVRPVRADQPLPFDDGEFDLAVAAHMLYHLPDPTSTVAELARVLAPPGTLAVTTNGRHHQTELYDLAAGGRADDRFSFAREFAVLVDEFDDVTFARRPDELRVTEAEAVIGYLRSLPEQRGFSENAAEQVRRQLNEEIASNGYWRARKDVGLFLARRRRPPTPIER